MTRSETFLFLGFASGRGGAGQGSGGGGDVQGQCLGESSPHLLLEEVKGLQHARPRPPLGAVHRVGAVGTAWGKGHQPGWLGAQGGRAAEVCCLSGLQPLRRVGLQVRPGRCESEQSRWWDRGRVTSARDPPVDGGGQREAGFCGLREKRGESWAESGTAIALASGGRWMRGWHLQVASLAEVDSGASR